MNQKKKKINPVFMVLGGLIVFSLSFIAIAGNQASEGETAIEELHRDTVGLILAVSERNEDKIQQYQRDYTQRKNPVFQEKPVTPKFNIEESNLSEEVKKTSENDVKNYQASTETETTYQTEKQVEGTYESPYKNNESKASAKVETNSEKAKSQSSQQEESLFNTSSVQNTRSSTTSSGKYKAVIHGDQKIREGGQVKLRLQEDAIISGKKVPRNTIFFGSLLESQGRLQIVITQFGSVSGKGIVLDSDQQEGIRYDQAVDSPFKETGKSIGRQITSDLLQSLPGGRYADQLIRSAKSTDGSIYLIDQYKIFIQVE